MDFINFHAHPLLRHSAAFVKVSLSKSEAILSKRATFNLINLTFQCRSETLEQHVAAKSCAKDAKKEISEEEGKKPKICVATLWLVLDQEPSPANDYNQNIII